MDLNGRAMAVVGRMLGDAGILRVEPRDVDGGGRVVDCGIEAQGGLRAGLELARACMADLADVAILSGTVGGRAARSSRWRQTTRSPLPGEPVRRLAPVEGKYFAMGWARCGPPTGTRRSSRRSGTRKRPVWSSGSSKGGRCPPGRRGEGGDGLRGRAGRCDAPVRPSGEPGGGPPGGGPVGRDGPAQATRSTSTWRGGLRRRGAAAGGEGRPRRDRPDQRRDPLGARVVHLRRGGRRCRSKRSARGSRHRPLATTASRRDDLRRYNNDFYAVDSHLSARPRGRLQNVETGRVHAFGSLDRRRSSPAPSIPIDPEPDDGTLHGVSTDRRPSSPRCSRPLAPRDGPGPTARQPKVAPGPMSRTGPCPRHQVRPVDVRRPAQPVRTTPRRPRPLQEGRRRAGELHPRHRARAGDGQPGRLVHGRARRGAPLRELWSYSSRTRPTT
jgi:methenyltetrahydromethanopterin cyclohydrolase